MANESANLDQSNSPSKDIASGAVGFAIFEFDFSTSELRRNGLRVRLQAQPAKVLSYLLAHAGRIVSREELHEAIWGTSTYVDFERGLNVCVAQIRSALGDDSSAPRFIRTIPRKGYEFICPVQNLAAELYAESPQLPTPTGHRTATGRSLFAATAALLVISVALAAYVHGSFRSHAAPITIAVARFDNETGDPQLDRFSDALTDDVVAQLTDNGQKNLRVIGNAAILRVSRQQRDLGRIAGILNAQFVILGQVQRIGSQTRILAHLIRLPDQTHVWVVRLDQPIPDLASIEASASREIAAQFSAKLANAASLTALQDTTTH